MKEIFQVAWPDAQGIVQYEGNIGRPVYTGRFFVSDAQHDLG